MQGERDSGDRNNGTEGCYMDIGIGRREIGGEGERERVK